ncbi:MAG: hypothetical protein JRE23_18835, partial [Deltaproteobacteria bacterium]|nr:hypothetical protein [Deltaproteobacteria bacterium]
MRTLKPGWKMLKFGDIVHNVAVRVNPADATTDVYVGLEHLDPSTLHLRQWGHPSDVSGQKLAFKKGDVIFGRRRAYQRKLAADEAVEQYEFTHKSAVQLLGAIRDSEICSKNYPWLKLGDVLLSIVAGKSVVGVNTPAETSGFG